MPVVRSRSGTSVMVTQSLTPSNVSAPPYFPEPVQVAPEIVPVCPLPDASATVDPEPWLKP